MNVDQGSGLLQAAVLKIGTSERSWEMPFRIQVLVAAVDTASAACSHLKVLDHHGSGT